MYQIQAIELNRLPITKRQDYPHRYFQEKGSDQSIIFDKATWVLPADINFGFSRYIFCLFIKENLDVDYIFVTGDVKVTSPIT